MRLPRGVGLGWRPEIATVVAGNPQLVFSEVVAENAAALLEQPGRLWNHLDALAHRIPVIPHGISLSIGSAHVSDLGDVGRLATVAQALNAPLISEHMAFVRGCGLEAGHLLPCPRTREAVRVIARHAATVRAQLPAPLALEVIAALLTWPEDELSDAQFATEVCEAADVQLVLDIANVYANARNRGEDPQQTLQSFPLERIAYCHIAGGVTDRGVYLDTHTHPVPPEVLELTEVLAELAPDVPVLLERDGEYPLPTVLDAELEEIQRRLDAGAARARRIGPTVTSRRTQLRSDSKPTGHSTPLDSPTASDRSATSKPTDEQHSEQLRTRQDALVAALIRGTPPPTGVAPEEVAHTTRVLLRKRWAALRRHWPVLAAVRLQQAGQAGAFQDFATWALAHRTAGGLPLGGFGDGLGYAADLDRRGLLPRLAARDVATARLSWRVVVEAGVTQLVARRWRGVGLAQAGGVLIAATGTAQQPHRLRLLTRPSR